MNKEKPKYLVSFTIYHGCNEDNCKYMRKHGLEDTFFTNKIERAKLYSDDGTIIRKGHEVKFLNLREAKSYVQFMKGREFIDFLITDKPNSFRKDKFKPTENPNGKAEMIYITPINKDLKNHTYWTFEILPPSDKHKQNNYQHKGFKRHKVFYK